MRRALVLSAVALGVLAPSAQADSVLVSMGTTAFLPGQVDILTGDTVAWRNISTKTHNVKFDTEDFDSGRIAPRGATSHAFATPGSFAYVCTIHDGMNGTVAVHPLLLSGPRGPVRRGAPVALHVRAPEGSGAVTIEEDSGSGWVAVATAGPPPPSGHEGHVEPGTLHATVVPPGSARYRAVSGAGVSPELRVQVSDGTQLAVSAKRARKGSVVRVRALPADPRARVVLELKLRERFGWWPVARARLDRRSRATFTVRGHGRVPARVVLVGGDWVTPLATSRAVRLPRPR